MKKKNKIFVAGIPRSGTTLVQNLLDSHSKIYGGPEFDRIPNIVDLRNKLKSSLKQGRIEAYTNVHEIDDAIRCFIDTLLTPKDLNPAIKFISEKTPWNILFFEELIEIFPDAKFIMVLRNPLDVFNSMKKVANNAFSKGIKPPDFTTDYKIACAYMEEVFKLMKTLNKKHPNKVIIVRYESFLIDLETEAKRLFDFLGLTWEEQVMNFYKLQHPGEKTMTQNDVWYTKNQFKANPQEVTVKHKKNLLKFKEKLFIAYLFRQNKYVNPNYSFIKKPNIFEKLIARYLYVDYKNNYRFPKSPKRTLN